MSIWIFDFNNRNPLLIDATNVHEAVNKANNGQFNIDMESCYKVECVIVEEKKENDYGNN